LAKRYIKKTKLATQLANLFISYSLSTIPWPFYQICDRRAMSHKDEILWNQYMIDLIDEIYKEYLEIGEKKFVEKYATDKKYYDPKRIPKTKLRSESRSENS